MTVAAESAQATTTAGETRRIALSLITPVPMREKTSEHIVRQYAADMARGNQAFPPIVVFYDGTRYWLGEGMHRWLAAQTIRREDILALVLPGGEREAVEYAAVEAPKDHRGLAYTPGDQQLRVKRMWQTHPEWAEQRISNVKIAEACGVSEGTVRNARDRYHLTEVSSQPCEDTESASPDMPSVPIPPTSEASGRRAESPRVRVRRTRNGKTQEYDMRQPPAPEPESEDDSIDPSPFLGMKMGTVLHLMADFHKKVRTTLGSDFPDKEMLDAYWESVGPRDWPAFAEHYHWLRTFDEKLHAYLRYYHTSNGKLSDPPKVREARQAVRGKRQA